jgi:threonine aldolase
VIDLRSDTATRPTAGMRAAIAAAEVGDEQRREDPSVTELQRRTAELLGHEAALFVPTATMANQIALGLHARPGDVLLAEATSHVLVYEYGGPAVHAGLITMGLPGRFGRITPEQLRAAAPGRTKAADQAPAVLSLENTHNSSGGRVWPLGELERVVAAARELGLAVHLDGARLANAAVALGVPLAAVAAGFDTVTLCLSKGLGCPLGALLAGPAPTIERAWRGKHLFGGAMRQAGIVAAAGLYALDHHLARLADDHARARRLGDGLRAAGVPVDPAQVETNFVQLDLAPLGLGREEALGRLAAAGVGLSPTVHPTILRAVTHLDVADADVEEAIELIPAALGLRASRGARAGSRADPAGAQAPPARSPAA